MLFRLVRVCQYFFQHGTHRPERRFNLRYSHFDVEVDDGGSADTAEPEGGPYRLQQRLNLIRQALMSPQTPAAKAQLARLLRGLPLFYALDLEGFRLLHTGTPVEVLFYRLLCRNRGFFMETYPFHYQHLKERSVRHVLLAPGAIAARVPTGRFLIFCAASPLRLRRSTVGIAASGRSRRISQTYA